MANLTMSCMLRSQLLTADLSDRGKISNLVSAFEHISVPFTSRVAEGRPNVVTTKYVTFLSVLTRMYPMWYLQLPRFAEV